MLYGQNPTRWSIVWSTACLLFTLLFPAVYFRSAFLRSEFHSHPLKTCLDNWLFISKFRTFSHLPCDLPSSISAWACRVAYYALGWEASARWVRVKVSTTWKTCQEKCTIPFLVTHSHALLHQVCQRRAVCGSKAPTEPSRRRTHHCRMHHLRTLVAPAAWSEL